MADRVIHLRRLTLRRHGAARLVLVFFQVHLQLEHRRQIAPGLHTATASITLKGQLDIGKRRFSAQQMLQRLLLRLNRLLQIHSGETLGSGHHGRRRRLQVFHEGLNLLVGEDQLPGPGPPRQSLGLLGQGGLQFRQQRGIVGDVRVLLLCLGLLPEQIPGRHQNLFLPLGDLLFTLTHAAAHHAA